MRNRFAAFVMVILARFGTISVLAFMFLPPDAQNPHAIHDVLQCFLAATFWTIGDFMIVDLVHGRER